MKTPNKKSKLSMPLAKLLDEYIATRPGIRPESVTSYRYSLRAFEKHLGRRARLKDLNDSQINKYVSWKLSKFSPSATQRDRVSLMVWWRYAARKRLLPPPLPGCVPTVKVPRTNPIAWTVSEVGKILKVCDALDGRMRRTSDRRHSRYVHAPYTGPLRSQWWSSLILFLYDTGCRIGAALQIAPGDIDLSRGLVTLRSAAAKTGMEQILTISRQTVDAIRHIYDSQSQRVWMIPAVRRLFQELGKILKQAGLPHDRCRKFHCLRKTCATLTVAAGRADLARRTMGHLTAGLMERFYVDQRALSQESAADVLPRPNFGEKPSGSVSATSQTANGHDVTNVLAKLSGNEIETLLKLAKALADSN